MWELEEDNIPHKVRDKRRDSSTFTTSVQQWLDMVSSLKVWPLSFSSDPLSFCSPILSLDFKKEVGALSGNRLPESSFSENLSKQFPTPCQAASINTPPIPSPPGNRYPACGVGLPGPGHERTGSVPWGMCSSCFHSKPVLCCSGQLL